MAWTTILFVVNRSAPGVSVESRAHTLQSMIQMMMGSGVADAIEMFVRRVILVGGLVNVNSRFMSLGGEQMQHALPRSIKPYFESITAYTTLSQIGQLVERNDIVSLPRCTAVRRRLYCERCCRPFES